jgi:FlaA1/EpsC-like NDP-sugar epimerase
MVQEDARGRVFVLDMGKPVKIVDLARTMITLAGLRPDHDVRIEFTGLRKGEKLYEELFDSEETAPQISVDGVFVVSPKFHNLAWMESVFDQLERAARKDEIGNIVALLSSIVPEPQFLKEGSLAAELRGEIAVRPVSNAKLSA